MKLIRHGDMNREKPGLLTPDGRRLDASRHFADWDRAFFDAGGLAKLGDLFAQQPDQFEEVAQDTRWGAPVARPGKVLCIGLNYSDHAAESGMEVPSEPVLFMKAPNTVIGPFDDVHIPRGSEKTDWEVELGVIIGKEARYCESLEEARDCIAGYCISHDVSERAFQLESTGQWTKGKSCDRFNPLGPFMATPDELQDVASLQMTLEVNGERMQDGNTATMVFDPAYLVHYISRFMTLEAGDLISTGTPPGVGLGQKPPRYLKAGDVVALGIDGLGEQKQTFVSAP